ncbi:MAG TPA: nuclear transport factor 2 family protein [Chitinophagaceae bacterium]|jgi:uncharacterized protein (TIGR02246 family)|nr:nuclear transport factor 2 family protein [Chitinophagaceae bacterium]
MKYRMFFALLFLSAAAFAQSDPDAARIRSLMAEQTKAWNRGDVAAFMEPYWQSDSLLFIGKSGVTRGWRQTLENYRRGYPDTAAMGKLAFDILEVQRLSPDYFSVVGKWMLQRTAGNLSGHFTLLVRRIGGRWVIVSDHSS